MEEPEGDETGSFVLRQRIDASQHLPDGGPGRRAFPQTDDVRLKAVLGQMGGQLAR
jgi:hypothetical protein